VVPASQLRTDGVALQELAVWDVEQQRYQWSQAPQWLAKALIQQIVTPKEVQQWYEETGL